MHYDMDMVQISDGLTQTAACGSAAVYDMANGLVFVSYLTGLPKRYGDRNCSLSSRYVKECYYVKKKKEEIINYTFMTITIILLNKRNDYFVF